MNLKKINTVKIKLTISILLLTLFIVSFVGIYFPEKFKQEQLKALDDKAKTTSSIIASNISSSIFFNDTDVLKEDLDRLTKDNEIGYIVVKTENNILYYYNLDEAQKYYYENSSNIKFIEDDVYFKTIEKVIIGKEEVGKIYIGFRLLELNQQLSEIRKNLFLINMFMLLFGVISAFVIGQFFTNPIHKLVVAAEEVKAGNFNARINISNKDEIGYLASRFNKMIETISEFYVDLENKVASRTKELAETNTKLENEILERINAERKIKQSLEEKVLLLKEIHHRVKNNLQIISSLLFLQSDSIEDPVTKGFFTNSQNRILSMSLVHENLYKNEDLSRIDFASYIRQLTHNITNSYSNTKDINIITKLDTVFLPVDISIPLGLIFNELMTNTIKHAFSDELYNSTIVEKQVHINLKNDENIIIEISDNGKGLPVDLNPDSINSLGMRIVVNLVNQIGAELKYENIGGAKFTVILKRDSLYEDYMV